MFLVSKKWVFKKILWLMVLISILVFSACLTTESTAIIKNNDVLKIEHPLAGMRNFVGKDIHLPSLENKITIVDFWASWCGPCKEAFPYFDEMQRKFGKKHLQVIAVSLDENPHAAIRFKNQMRPSFKTYWDPENELSDRFRVQALPTTLILDSKGELVHRHTGFDLRSHMMLEAQVRSLLNALE